jgi:5-methylthioribose kinase
MSGVEGSAYRQLEVHSVPEFIAPLSDLRTRLGGDPAAWRVREVGDGNLNLVFIVEGLAGSLCVKQAVPYVRAAGPSWPMSLERVFFEKSYYAAVADAVGARVPTVYHYDPTLFCLVMERLSPHIILREGLIAGQRYPRLARDMGEYVAQACFRTSDLARPFEEKMTSLALFTRNQALLRISVDLIFADPFIELDRNRHTTPQLDAVAARLRRDARLKIAVARYGHKFLAEPQALLHGDLHTGSVMVTPDDTRVIDPEFAFYGPIGFDLGAFFGNLLLSWYAQPGLASGGDPRISYQEWILDQAQMFWDVFRSTFLTLWESEGRGDAYPAALFQAGDRVHLQAAREAYLDQLFTDMLGFAACKMIRRILGFAHVADFERIDDPTVRAACESGALAMARILLVEPERFRSVADVIEVAPMHVDQRFTAPH